MSRRDALRLLLALAITLLPSMKDGLARGPSVTGGRLVFSVHDLEGRVVSSDDPRFAGRVVMVDLWGTWCPPCLTEIPTLIELQEKYGERGLIIVGMAFEREGDPETRRSALREFALDRSINYLVLDGGDIEDFEKTLPMLQDVKGFPVEIFIDRNGRVVESRHGYGYKARWAKKLDKKVGRLLDEVEEQPAPQ